MKIIDRYIIRKFLETFFFIIILFILIAIVFDFSEKVDDFLNRQAPIDKIIFVYYLNFIPYFMNLFSPLFIFISAVYFTSRMAANTEIVAVLTSGTNFYRLLYPYFLVSLFLAGLSFYLNGWVIPHGNKKLIDFENKYIQTTFSNDRAYIHRQVSPGTFIYLRNFTLDDSSGYRFSMEIFKKNELVYKLQARRIKWVEAKKQWLGEHYFYRKIENGKESINRGEKIYLNLQITPADFGRKTANITTMTNPELDDYIEKERLRGEELVNYYLVERHRRVSLPFATFVLVLIAFSLSSRKMRGGTGLHLGLGILIAFAYILMLQFTSVFATRAGLDPVLSVWLPNILYAILGFILLILAPK